MSTVIMESALTPRPHHHRLFTATSSPRAAATFYDFDGNGFASKRGGLRISKVGRRSAFDTMGSSISTPRIGIRRSGTVVCEAQDTVIDVRDVTKETWKSLVIECQKPVLVEFWAPWCGPCRMILPLIGKLSKTYEGKIECYKLNTDESPDIATQYGIRSIPTIMMFKNGEKKDVVIGAVPESTLVNCIEKFV